MLVSTMANSFSLYPNKNKLNTWWSSRPMVVAVTSVLEQLRKEKFSAHIASGSQAITVLALIHWL